MQVDSDKYTIPEDAPLDQRIGQMVCPTDSVCKDGLKLPRLVYQTGCPAQLEVDENLALGLTSPQEKVTAFSNVGTQANGAAVPLTYKFEPFWDYVRNVASNCFFQVLLKLFDS